MHPAPKPALPSKSADSSRQQDSILAPGDSLSSAPAESPTAIRVSNLDFSYGQKTALSEISLAIPQNQITAFIGPSGCGKSTLLRCFNRMNDRIPNARVTAGSIHVLDHDIANPKLDLVTLRQNVGMVFQKSLPFPGSIFDNVAYGLRIHGLAKKKLLADAVEEALANAALWDEVKDRLHSPAQAMSGGQQQRLCIARAIATKPQILLMDEPCSALDPIATLKVEELMIQLKSRFTLVVVTHNMQQATRVSDSTAFFHLGKMLEFAPTLQMFTNPSHPVTRDYITGKAG